MLFHLRRLPFLAIREVIKSMNTREIFLLSLASKKSANFVMLSISKDSLLAKFTFNRHRLLFELMPKGYFEKAHRPLPEDSYRIEEEFVPTSASSDNLHVQCEFYSSSGTSEAEESIRKLFYSFSKKFKKSEIFIKFEDGTSEGFVIEIIRFAWENGIALNEVDFFLDKASSETIQELLNGCNKHYTSLKIETRIPKEFKCTPPIGGYKFKSLIVDYARWVTLDDFLQCREFRFWTEFPDLTVEYLNGLLMKIVNMECRLERFVFDIKSINPSDFPEIVRGLSESAIQQEGAWQGLQFERKDGLKLMISLSNGYLDLENDLKIFKSLFL
ncbi:unnamed protein product [Caenorhabditis brenneri]